MGSSVFRFGTASRGFVTKQKKTKPTSSILDGEHTPAESALLSRLDVTAMMQEWGCLGSKGRGFGGMLCDAKCYVPSSRKIRVGERESRKKDVQLHSKIARTVLSKFPA